MIKLDAAFYFLYSASVSNMYMSHNRFATLCYIRYKHCEFTAIALQPNYFEVTQAAVTFTNVQISPHSHKMHFP